MKNDFLGLPNHPTMQLAYKQTQVCPLFKSLGVTAKRGHLLSALLPFTHEPSHYLYVFICHRVERICHPFVFQSI